MTALRTFTPPDDRLSNAACRRDDVDPDWWTDTHPNKGHLKCGHVLARHLCRVHCPVLEQCREDEALWGTDWGGMVIAGELRTNVAGRSIPAKVQPSGPVICRICIGASVD